MAKDVKVEIVGDASKYKAALADASSASSKFASDNKKNGETMSKFGIGALAVAGAIGVGLFKAGEAASDLNESVNAVRVTFGKAADGVLKLGENAAESMGLSNSAFNGLAVQFSAFTQTIAGKGGDVVATLKDLTGRAADFASVMNIEVKDAATLFQSGLAGETEPLRKYGIDLSAAAVQAYAAANGIGKFGEQLTEAEKVTARYGLLMQSTSKDQGDFANTSDSAANAMRIAKAEMENAAASLGTSLMPILATAASTVGDFAKKIGGLNEATGGWLAKGAGIAAMLLGTVGAMSFVIGQSIKMHERFTDLGKALSGLKGKLFDAEGGLTKLGKGGVIAGAAMGALAVGIFAVSDHAKNLAERLDFVKDTAADLSRVTDAGIKEVLSSMSFQILAAKDLDGTMKTLAQTNLEGAKRALDLGAANGLSAKQTEALRQAIIVEEAAVAQQAKTTADAEAATKAATGATEDAALTADDYTNVVTSLIDAVKAQEEATRKAEQAEKDNRDAIADGIQAQRDMTSAREDAVFTIGDLEQSLRDLDTGYYDLQQQQLENIKTQKDHKLSDDEKDQSNRDLASSEHNLAEKIAETAQEYADQSGAVDGTKQHTDMMVNSLIWQKEQYPLLAAEIQKYIDKLLNIPTDVNTNIHSRTIGAVRALAGGGPGSGTTLVGEKGPELVDLPSGSYVHTAAETAGMGGSGGGPMVINITMPVGTNGNDVVRAIKEFERRNGPGWRT